MAEDTALRLGAPSPAADPVAAAATAAAAAATAAANGVPPDVASEQGRQAAVAAQATKPRTPPGPLSQLVKYIPTETITLYIAVLGALGDISVPEGQKLSDADFSSRWLWLVVLLGATVLLTLGLSFRTQRNANSTEEFKFTVPYFEVGAASAAFVVWALSLPSTPLRDIDGYDYNAWNSVIILAGTIAIATAAYVFGKTVTWQKVLDD